MFLNLYEAYDMIPAGWQKAFGKQMIQEIKNTLIKLSIPLDEYIVLEVKEKYGELRWYAAPYNEELEQVYNKYTKLSTTTCIKCGAAGQMNHKLELPLCAKEETI